MKKIKTTEAEGVILCQDVTQIIPGVVKGPRFRKGHLVKKEDIPILLSMGKEHLYIWENQENVLHEEEAAHELFDLCKSEYLVSSEVKEGKIEAIATVDGLLSIDVARLAEINKFGELMIATKWHLQPIKKNTTVAGMRIIPLFIEKEKIQQLKQQIGPEPLLKILPYSFKKVGIITTGSEVYHGRIKDGFKPALEKKLANFPTKIIAHKIVDDSMEMIVTAIQEMEQLEADVILCTGGMSVDADDLTPKAIQKSGAQVVTYGTPVLPGAMFLLAYTKTGTAIMGLPGAVMFADQTVFDLVLPKVMADKLVTRKEIAAWGHGGLL